MSNCFKDLYHYDLVKKCWKCGNIQLKSNFHNKLGSKGGLDPQCVPCVKKYYLDNRDRVKRYYLNDQDRLNNYQKKNNYENKEKFFLYTKNRIKTDVNFRLIRNTRRRIHQALNGKSKSSSTGEILGIDIDLYRKWIEWHLTPEMIWSKTEVDHIKPICMFDVSKEEELKKAFNWKTTQPLLKHDHHQKGTKFNFLHYQLQFIKAYRFIKLNEERFNEIIH